MSGNSPGCSKSLMLAKAFIWTVAGALRPKRDCLRSEHERDYDLGMDALVSALIETRTEIWFGHGCSGQRMRFEQKGIMHYGLGMDALVSVCSWNTTGIKVWAWMLWSAHSSKHERNYGLGMDALVSALIETRTEMWFGHGCSGLRTHQNTNGIMVWAWMLWSAYAFGTEGNYGLWFGHGCSGQRTHRNTKGNMVWAKMLWSAHSSKHDGN